ncbi:MAG: 3-hydroxyacyl-CoA dehydrogenase family protein [Parachlamydiaceae bacterium]|nr:3-hydroxyacyl-CoA dehydrogenase family protein [Parachlamydiaceae bacterium]
MSKLHWKKCAVIGAAGKMGRGIALILLLEMAVAEVKETAGIGKNEYRLVLIDINREALDNLKDYLKTHLLKYAEKQINRLREYYQSNALLVSNKEIIDDFLARGMGIVHCTTSLHETAEIPVIFEAVVEDINAKCELYKKIASTHKSTPFILTNTSSIPISVLNAKANLQGRIIGFHLYNPPAVQKLLEIIPLKGGDPDLYALALEVGQALGKRIVVSKDVAGFIGNGHFMREIAYACSLVKELSKSYTLAESIYMVNRVTGDFLLRPMGIFQLIDYVGLDVIQNVGAIMNENISEKTYENDLLHPLLAAGRKGGQHPDGTQKDGFFSYQGKAITGIYDSSHSNYIDLSKNQWQKKCDEILGNFPEGNIPWSTLSRDANHKQKIEDYLKNLSNCNSTGCNLGNDFLRKSQSIVNQLVDSHVAASKEDVETVLKNGFFHLYV